LEEGRTNIIPPNLVAIGPVVSEKKIKVYDVRRRTPSDSKSSPGLWLGELKTNWSMTQAIFMFELLH
jgi:hypothetical protein